MRRLCYSKQWNIVENQGFSTAKTPNTCSLLRVMDTNCPLIGLKIYPLSIQKQRNTGDSGCSENANEEPSLMLGAFFRL